MNFTSKNDQQAVILTRRLWALKFTLSIFSFNSEMKTGVFHDFMRQLSFLKYTRT